MTLLWSLAITFAVAQPLTAGEMQWLKGMCAASGGNYVELWGDPDVPNDQPQSPHTAKCFLLEDAPAESDTEFKPDV